MAVAQTISPMEAAIAAVLQRWLSVPFSLPDANCAIDLLDYAETLTGRRYAGRPSRVQVLRIARDPHGVVEIACLLYTSPSPRDRQKSRMPSSA